MADVHPFRSGAVHPGVDPQTWLGFEQRIQARRFDALIASAREAIATNNLGLAVHALEEAREIRPRAPEIQALAAAIDRLTVTRPEQQWRRIAGGVCLLATGVLMFIGLDQVRVVPGSLPPVLPAPLPLRYTAPAPVPIEADDRLKSVAATASVPPTSPAVPPTAPVSRVERTETPRPRAVAPLPVEPRLVPAALKPATPTTASALLARPAALVAVSDDEASTQSSAATEVSEPFLNEPSTMSGPVASTVAPPAPVVIPPRATRAAEEQTRVADVLSRYARAYGDLDVNAAREVWPNVDQRALSRAFEGLASQTVSFEDCQIDVEGVVANASCRGHASYVGKVGRGVTRTEPRTWRFELRRDGETWKIANAEADKN